jgi:hypothetical protein
VNTAKREFESAKAKKAETTNLEDLADLLKGARSKARDAQRLFDHHVAMHHCHS